MMPTPATFQRPRRPRRSTRFAAAAWLFFGPGIVLTMQLRCASVIGVDHPFGLAADGGGLDSGSTLDAGASLDSGSTLDAGASLDSGSTLDAGALLDSGGTLDAGGDAGDGGSSTTVVGPTCGTGLQCAAVTGECCYESDAALSCVPVAEGCTGGTDIVCENETQCNGGVCCIDLDSNQAILSALCRTGYCRTGELVACNPASGTDCATGTCTALAVPSFSNWFWSCQ